ncbi:unnamed protein product [Clonostachys byssicola]|uniref:Uncharacterized protein n=1 Tax=Clonostachys byssicola TaxID=160290 RepID=A0A9N9Y1U5_9HYPO|nr:unnamed protein product [Clonostachys byssicola]
MEDHVFDSFLELCKEFAETLTGLEIFNYTDPAYNSCKEYELFSNNASDFLYRRGAFKPPVPSGNSLKCIGGMRLIIQTGVVQLDTPTSRAISLPKQLYREMFNAFHLNKRSVDAGSTSGSSFWAVEDGADGDSYLALNHRQSFDGDNGEAHVCEMILSYSFQTRLTCGYLRGSPKSNLAEVVAQMRALPQQMLHPISLPVLLASYQLTAHKTQSCYDARARLEQLEYNVAQCQEAKSGSEVMVFAIPCDTDALVREMAECYRDTTSNSTKDYGAVLEGIEEALDTFWDMCSVFDIDEIKTIISQKHMKLVNELAAERRNGGFIDQNWNKTPVTKLPAVLGPSYLPIFLFVGVLSFGFLAIRVVNFLLNWPLFMPIGLSHEGDSGGQSEGPSMRPVDVVVYVLSLVPMMVFATLLYKSGRRKGPTIKKWDMEKSQNGSKEVSLPANGELPARYDTFQCSYR